MRFRLVATQTLAVENVGVVVGPWRLRVAAVDVFAPGHAPFTITWYLKLLNDAGAAVMVKLAVPCPL